MSTTIVPAPGPSERLKTIGLAIAGFGPLATAALLVPLRTDIRAPHAVLALVIVVVLGAATGGRAAGATASLVATLSYDFFLTRPYNSLKIGRGADLATVLLLLTISLIVSEVVAFVRRGVAVSDRWRDELARVHRISQLVAANAETDDVVLAVEAELIGLLALRDCFFESPPFATELPQIEPSGWIAGTRRHVFVRRGFALPADGVAIPIRGGDQLLGRLVLVPDPDVAISIQARAAAVALADQLAIALTTDLPRLAASEWEDA